MLERPDIQDEKIINCLRAAYGLEITTLQFMPLGADRNTAVFRAQPADGRACFVKLRSGPFDEQSILIPAWLHQQGMPHIIAPLPTQDQRLWVSLEPYRVAVFPFVEGQNAYEQRLLDRHWVMLGRAVRRLHGASLPPALSKDLAQEQYASGGREKVQQYQRQAASAPFRDAIAIELAAFLRQQASRINALVQRAGELAALLQAQALPLVLCHADLHAGNLLIDAEQQLYLVDWDTLMLAPKERDLMFIGGGLFANMRPPEEEIRLFYQGYGQVNIHPLALAYYRYERIVQDIGEFCDEILMSSGDSADRANSLRLLKFQFQPGEVVDLAFHTEQALPR